MKTSFSRSSFFLEKIDDYLSGFVQVREAHRRELIDDYIELIADLIIVFGEARQVDLAVLLGVKQPTVAKMLKKLISCSLIRHEKYHGILLTEHGEKLAKKNHLRHNIVKSFLKNIGVSKKIAQRDSEGIEHHVSAETLLIFSKFSERYDK